MRAERVLRAIARGDLARRETRADRPVVDHLAKDLPRALERNDLVLHFQPIIELRTGRCFRAEALVRWAHPTAGIIESRDVVRLAELTNRTLDLALWTVRESVRLRAAWQRDDLELGVSVNLAGPELANDGHAKILDALRAARARPAAFTFELAAATLARDDALRDGLRALANAGSRIALDDVSEANLPQRATVAQFDEQKISRSLVLRASSDEAAALSLRRILALGKDLGLLSVAVGVEDEPTYRMLGWLGCELAQGYWMSRPLASTDVAQWHAWLARAVLAGTTAVAAFSGLAKFAAAATAPVREPLGGPSSGVSLVASEPGTPSSCCAIRAPVRTADVGVSLRTVSVDGTPVHVEGVLSDADVSRITDAVRRDVTATRQAFGVAFDRAPEVYVFASRGSFALGLQRGFAQRATDAAALAAANGGVAFSDQGAIAINWENVRGDVSLSIVRHELTHLLAHQIVGADAEVPAWFDEGLATLMEREVLTDAYRDARADSATLAMLHRNDATLQELSSARDWTMKNAALAGAGYTIAAAGVEVLRESIGLAGITALLHQARATGFAQAFGEATGGSPADFSLAFPARFASTHGGLHLAQEPSGDGVKWAIAGLAANAPAHVTIDGAGYHLAFDVTADRDGTYSALFGWTAQPGAYTITVTSGVGSASANVSIGGR